VNGRRPAVDDLVAGYGAMEIRTHQLPARRRPVALLIGPNGTGKSTVLHSIYGSPRSSAQHQDRRARRPRQAPSAKLKQAGIAYTCRQLGSSPT